MVQSINVCACVILGVINMNPPEEWYLVDMLLHS